MINEKLLKQYEYNSPFGTKKERVKQINIDRIYAEIYGDTIINQTIQKIKKAEISEIIEAYERMNQ